MKSHCPGYSWAGMNILAPCFFLIIFAHDTPFHSVLHNYSTEGFSIEEATIPQIQQAFKAGKLTSRGLVEFYLDRIEKFNPILHAVIEVNPDALLLADMADTQRLKAGETIKSALHGIPVLVKDNIASNDKLNTTAGSFSLLGCKVARDAGVVNKLRKSGAIILGKASLTEWAAFRSNSAPSGWSARGGQAKNPYVLTADPCGSSTGSANTSSLHLHIEILIEISYISAIKGLSSQWSSLSGNLPAVPHCWHSTKHRVKMAGLHSAIREQARNRNIISSKSSELEEPNDFLYEPYEFTEISSPFIPCFEESEDFDVISEWIREPDCIEIANVGTNCSTAMEVIGRDSGAQNESRDSQNEKQVSEEFNPSMPKVEPCFPGEVESIGTKFGDVSLDGDGGEFALEKVSFEYPTADTEDPSGENTLVPAKPLTTNSNGVSGISTGNEEILSEKATFQYRAADTADQSGENMLIPTKPLPASSSVVSGVSLGIDGSLLRPKEEYDECANLVQSDEKIYEETEKIGEESDRELKKANGEENEVESGEILGEHDRQESQDCTGIVEFDSEYSSDSSLSSDSSSSDNEDDEEVEEGEIRPKKGRKNFQARILDDVLGSDEEEEGLKGPIRSKHELEVLPPVPPVNVALQRYHQIQPVGVITSVLGTSIVVEAIECHSALNEGTILWITEKRRSLGFIDEVFGPVKNPYYIVRYNTVADVPDYVREGVHVSYVPEYAKFVLKNDPSLYRKGYDASGEHDEELSDEVEFSDDEKEAEYKRERTLMKRGANSRENFQEKNYGRRGRKQEFVDKRKRKGHGGRLQHNLNNANGSRDQAQMGFALKQPFHNSSFGWPPSTAVNQIQNCNRPRAPSPSRPPPVQSQGMNQTTGNNLVQQSPQILSSISGSSIPAATLMAYTGRPSQGSIMCASEPPPWGVFNSKPNQNATGGMHPTQPPIVGEHACDTKLTANSASVVHSGSQYDQAKGTCSGQPHTEPFHDPLGQTLQSQTCLRPQHDPAGGIQPGQPSSRPPVQDSTGVHLVQPLVLGAPILSGNQMNSNLMNFPHRPMHPAFMGEPAQYSSIHPSLPSGTWTGGHSSQVAGGPQVTSSDANQGAVNPMLFNQMQTCVGVPFMQNPGLYPSMGMNVCNIGSLPGQNILPCPMPWGQFPPVFQGNPNQQFQNGVQADNGSVPFSQPNNMSGNHSNVSAPFSQPNNMSGNHSNGSVPFSQPNSMYGNRSRSVHRGGRRGGRPPHAAHHGYIRPS